MDTIPLWCIIFINCITLLSSVWILIYLYRNRSKKSFSTYIYGIASLIGLFLGVISFFYYICHAFCAILFGIEIFIDTYMYGHENEMYKEPMNLKRGKDVYMRELRECGGRTEDKTKCAKG